MTVLHRNLTDPEIHEPKGISTALEDQVYIADGLGSGEWGYIPSIDPSIIEIPIGSVELYAGKEAPSGWFLCYGQTVSRSTYSNLFSIIGTTFGAGDGTTTFALPDCRGRALESLSDSSSIGQTGGSQSIQLSAGQIPKLSGQTDTAGAHKHPVSPSTSWYVNGSSYTAFGISGRLSNNFITAAGNHTHAITVNAASSNAPHSNVQPSIVFNVIIFHGVL